jgi:glyoxylase-like metal-dependent hydrolase (beta-lactamase superfamily II)
MSLPFPEEPGFRRIEVPEDAHPGAALVVEKRCVACHSESGIERTRFPSGEATPSVEAMIEQLRTPFRRMPAFSAEQVSDEEAALITEFFLAQLAAPQEQESVEVATPLEKVIEGVGGEAALQGLETLSLASAGSRWVHDEDLVPGSEPKLIGPFELQLNYDLGSDALRLDYTMESLGNERQLSEVVVGELGYFDGQAANFGPPGVSDMSSDRLVSIREHQRLMNPHLILQEVLADPSIVSEAGEVVHDGSVHHLLVIEDEIAPQTLYISAGTGLPAKLETIESDALRRDVPLEVFYYSWQELDDGHYFPAEIYVAYDGQIVHKELRSAIDVNPDLDSALFEIPAEVSPTFDEAVAARGEPNHQYLQTFGAYGFPRDGFQLDVTAVELAPGVFHLTGGSHHSLAIEQDDSIVIAEAPLDETRSLAVLDWAATTFPDKPVSHVVSSHHHVDHSAGLRAYVARGIPVVMHEAAEPFFEEIFLASSTLVPDELEANPVEATIETVTAAEPFITGGVEVYPIENSHAEDMVITYVPGAGVVFVADLYSPDPNASSLPPAAQLIHDRITELDLDVSTIAGGHGASIEFADFEALLDQ